MSEPAVHPTSSKPRRVGWWIFLGLILGCFASLGVLMLPPVQAWILRRAVATQPGTGVDFSRLALGPRGAEVSDVKLRLPNLTVEARALRLAISPWQLLSRRRLAIADLQAKQISVQAVMTTEAGAATPFVGVLDSFKAPLAWACAKAEADGVISVLQPGNPAVAVTFQLNGANLDITKPGRVDFQFTTPGELVEGFKGSWGFRGTLEFTPGPDEQIDALTIRGTLSPAISETLHLPSVEVQLGVTRTASGEHYEVALKPAGSDAFFSFSAKADFKTDAATLLGEWTAQGLSGFVSHLLQRSDLPMLSASHHGNFSINVVTGDADVNTKGTFTGSEWQRFDPVLAAVGRISGDNIAQLERRQGSWVLTQLNAQAHSDGSEAALQLSLDRRLALPPGGDGRSQPWGKLSVRKIPLGWTAPLLGLTRLSGGDFSGSWSVASPNAATLRFETLEPLKAHGVLVASAAMAKEKIPAASFEITSRLTLTATAAHAELPKIVITSEHSDRIEADVDARVSLETFQGAVKANWQSQLPTWLGGASAPALRGTIEADVATSHATIRAFRLAAVDPKSQADFFTLGLLSPVKVDFAKPEAVETGEGDVLKFSAHALPLDWAALLLPGFAITGTVSQGESLVQRRGREFQLITPTPWTLHHLAVVQGGVPLLRSPEFSLAPAGRVQLNADWSPGDFLGTIELRGQIAEIFRLRDPAGILRAEGSAHASRRHGVLELRSLNFRVKRNDGAALLDVETLQPATLGLTAKTNVIEQAPDWLRLRTTAIPLAWLQPLLPEGMELSGAIEPTDFSLKMELPNAYLRAAKPVTLAIDELREAGRSRLKNTRFEVSPAVIVMGLFSSVVLEDVRVSMEGKPTGSGSLSLIYLTSNLQMPGSVGLDFTHSIAPLRQQPIGAELPLPAGGTARLIYQHDIFSSKAPVGTFLLYDVPAADGKTTLPKLGVRVTQLERAQNLDRLKLEFQYQTAPVWSQINAEFSYAANQKSAEINTTLRGDFFDLSSFLQLVDAAKPAAPTAVTPHEAKQEPQLDSKTLNEQIGGAFWQTLRGRFDLEFGQLAYGSYRIDQLKGALTVDANTIQLSKLSGKMFEGDWSGNFLVDFDGQQPDAPYGLSGGFEVKDFSAAKIVESVYPNEIGSFDGRLDFNSHVTSRTASPLDLINQSSARFEFNSRNGRLKLNVPYANVASAGLLVGGAITFSPELRALGRLIKKFSDLPVETLSARGQRAADGAITLESFELSTPQLRLGARGKIPFQTDVDFAARPFELPVTLSAKDEIAVILRGMKLLEKKGGPDGYFPMTKQPSLRGTVGQPDTTELYDTFAKAVDASSGTFGFLMKKVRAEAEKTGRGNP